MFPASRLGSPGLQLQLYFLDATSSDGGGGSGSGSGSGVFVQLVDTATVSDGLPDSSFCCRLLPRGGGGCACCRGDKHCHQLLLILLSLHQRLSTAQ